MRSGFDSRDRADISASQKTAFLGTLKNNQFYVAAVFQIRNDLLQFGHHEMVQNIHRTIGHVQRDFANTACVCVDRKVFVVVVHRVNLPLTVQFSFDHHRNALSATDTQSCESTISTRRLQSTQQS